MAVARTTTYRHSLGPMARAMALLAFVLLGALVFAGRSQAAFESPPPPQVWSDKADYAPGELVTLSGANWAPGESVHIRVNDDAGQTWSRDVDVVADENGAITDQFNLPSWFVAVYTVTATGASSGTATWSFTDGNVTLHLTTAEALGASSITVSFDIYGRAGGGGFVDNTCSGAVQSSGTVTIIAAPGPVGGTANIPGFGNNNLSVRLGAVTSTPAGKTIDFWAVGEKTGETTPQVDLGATPCISANPSAGTNGNVGDAYAHLRNINTAPVCSDGTVTTSEDTSVSIPLSCTDAESNPLTYTVLSGPSNGTLSGTGASRTYTPNENYNGSDSFTFKANDGTVDSNIATVNITVDAVNDAPTCSNGSATTDEDTPVAANLSCADVDNASLTYTIVSGPTNGVLSGSGASRTYTPNENYNGPDSFTFRASDGSLDSNVATFSLTVNAVDDAPTVTSDEASVTVDEGQTATNSGTYGDVDGDAVALTASVGTVTKNADGTWDWSFDSSDGPDESQTVTITASDGTAGDEASVTFALVVNNVAPTVTFDPANDANVAEGSAAHTYSYTIFDPGADTVSAVSTSCDPPEGEKVAGSDTNNNTSGSFQCRFPDGPADADLTAAATDSDGETGAAAHQSVHVNNVAPTVTFSPANDTSVDEGTTHTYVFSVSDPGNDTFTVDSHSCGTYGEFVTGTLTTSASGGSFQCRFPDGPNSTNVSVRVSDSDGASDTDSEAVQVVAIANVAPTVELSGHAAALEGDTKTYTYTVSDPGDDPNPTITESCGANGTKTDTPAAMSFDCTFPEGPASSTVKVTADDGDPLNNVGSDEIGVSVANVAPDVDLVGDNSANEGQTKSYSYSWTDPGALDTFTRSVSCGPKGVVSNQVFTPSSKTGSFDCTFGDDSGAGTFEVKVTVTDDDGDSGSDSRHVDVDNVNPTASNGSFTLDPVFGTATVGFDFSDVGWLDTHGPNLSFFTWSDVGNRFATVTEENTAPDATGHASDTRTFAPGCFNLTVTGTAKDDDGGTSAPLAIHSDSSTAVFARGFRPPIMDNERNIAKYGNVVPVKVVLTNTCTGATVTNVPLFITIAKGVGDEAIEDTNLIAESVSAADSGSQMRTADGMYIYNLSTKSLQQNTNYTIRIRPYSTATPYILQAVLYPKK